MEALLDHCLQLARTPIGEGDYAGEDARYSEAYEALEQQIEREGALHAGVTVDWERVVEAADELLGKHSKDLRAATWYAWALQQRHGAPGLQAGVALLRVLCEEHWDAIHPLKSRTRQAALGWLLTRLERWLEDLPAAPGDAVLQALQADLSALDQCLGERLGDQAPLLAPSCRRLAELSREHKVEAPAEAPRTPSATPSPAPAAAAAAALPSSAPASERDAHRALRTLQDAARPLAGWWREQGAGDPRWLRLSRTLLWLPIEALPAHDADGNTDLRGLPADRLNGYRERFEQGRFVDLLGELEGSIARAPFWLDGQRLCWECLQQLGAEPAMRELESQMAALLQRLPGLDALRFHDGTPFADAHTRAWLGSCARPSEAPVAPTADAPASAQADWDNALAEAQLIQRREGLRAAVRHLKQGLAAAQGGRERFHWQLALARLCLSARQYELARAQLDALDHLLGPVQQAWEPDLLLQLLQLLRQCCEALPQNTGLRDRREEIHRRLCCLDLETVID